MLELDSKAAGKQQLSLFSPAKVNVFFQVRYKREDGFHEINSLYQAVSLFDTLNVRISTSDVFTCSDPLLPIDDTNLVLKALRLFRKKTGNNSCFSIHLDKKIPIQAGLGGGSSNAATALYAFARLTNVFLDQAIGSEWGAEIGSDVPFFFSSGAALASGRGEILKDADPYLMQPFWIIKPKQGLSTARVYANCKPIQRKKDFTKRLYNDLESAAFSLDPSLQELKNQLLKLGFNSVVMTGSGTAFFCVEGEKKHTEEEIQKKITNIQAFLVKPLQRKQESWYEYT